MVPPSMHCAEGTRSGTLRGSRPAASGAPVRRRSMRLMELEQNGSAGAEPVVGNDNVDGSTKKRRGGGGREVVTGKKSARMRMELENGEGGCEEVRARTAEVVESVQVPKSEEWTSYEDKVKAAVRIFNKTFLHCVQEEEERCGKKNVVAKSSEQKGSSKAASKTNQAS